ncbi:hypothetical protein BHE74_00043220 [Ensete ventricosum]|nr:hypothetical protein BHE74_00043220 [Ensete ventricosum]RZS17817.1 hypothetical protein BHM03_00050004 [Ensete ventricosum]
MEITLTGLDRRRSASSRWITWTYPSIKMSATNQNRIRVASVVFTFQRKKINATWKMTEWDASPKLAKTAANWL